MIEVIHTIHDSSTKNTISIDETFSKNILIKISSDKDTPHGYFSKNSLEEIISVLQDIKAKKDSL